jgi:hypothetical protein
MEWLRKDEMAIEDEAPEIPSTSLRAGSSLFLKNGYAQDDAFFAGHYSPPGVSAFRRSL